MKNSDFTVTDLFCGAGGSSLGVKAAAKKIPGLRLRMALNHWKQAIETHSENFPEADHDQTDISACNPRRYPSTTLLIASPECTNHTIAKGQKHVKMQLDLFNSEKIDPSAERSRATMWDVPRFAEVHNYQACIIENVVDARKWNQYPAWLMAMHCQGYKHKTVYANSMHHHPTPQSRDRMYVVFWKAGNKAPDLDYMPEAYCPKCCKNVHSIQSWRPGQQTYKYKTGYKYCCSYCSTVVDPYYYASFNCIDWSDPGIRIGDRKHPLSSNTIERINHGHNKYKDDVLFINDQHSTGIDCRVRSANDHPLQTITTDHKFKIAIPPAYIIKCEHSNLKNSVNTSMPFNTLTTRQSLGIVQRPFITVSQNGAKTIDLTDPINCVTAGGAKSGIVTDGSMKSFLSYYYSGSVVNSSLSDPLGTVRTKDAISLVNYSENMNIDDFYYRMLKANEIQLAMAFDPGYKVLGTSKDKVKQLGNAVTPPVMEWLISQVAKSLL